VSPDGRVRAQSVLWLFCWAKTGMNSEEARQVSAQIFDEILPITFAKFDAVLVTNTLARADMRLGISSTTLSKSWIAWNDNSARVNLPKLGSLLSLQIHAVDAKFSKLNPDSVSQAGRRGSAYAQLLGR